MHMFACRSAFPITCGCHAEMLSVDGKSLSVQAVKADSVTAGPWVRRPDPRVLSAFTRSAQLRFLFANAMHFAYPKVLGDPNKIAVSNHLSSRLIQNITPCGTRTRNLRIRSPTPCPLGQGGLLC